MTRPWLAAALLALLAPAADAAREAAHPTAGDVAALVSAGGLALSPDGTRAVFVRTAATFDSTAKPDADDHGGGWKRDRQLWLVTFATREVRALTQGDAAPSSPAWSPDGRSLAFVRPVGGRARLQRLDLTGGEARTLDTGALEPSSPRWSPDGRTLAFLAEPAPTAEQVRERWARGGAIAWEREWTSARLWRLPADGGAVSAVTHGEEHVVDYAWAPDSRRFALLVSASADPYVSSSFRSARVVDLAGAPLRVLDREAQPLDALAWSPDGRSVALLGLEGGLSDLNALLVWDVAGTTARELAPDPDRTFTSLAWAGDGRSLVATVSARTRSQLVRFPLAGAPTVLPFAGRVVSGPLERDAAGRRLAFLSATDREPDDVTVLDLPGGPPMVATALNPQVAAWSRGTLRVVRWKDAEGVEIEGLLTVAPSARPGAPAPLVVMPHGGPDDVSQERFSGLVHYLASRGYSVFRPNYRGSVGYGFAFYAANRNRFGEIEQADIESGVDALIAAGDARPDQLYFGGWSWGGYLTAWTLGHVQRYRAAVAGAAVSDVTLSYSLSDINHGVASQWEYRGDPWRQLEHFDRVNPIRYAKDMRTPTLVLHGQADARVPFQSSIQLYRALADMGAEVRFWAYPREDHGFVEPAHRVHYVRAWADWYDAH
jgi:dipeptidyl aminopeptidase/acylaminoacyl peptidase